jgi:hypothetical protein
MINFRFPTNVGLTEVVQDYVIESESLIGTSLMPMVPRDTQIIQWDELDFEVGMTSPHNMNTDPKIGQRPGSKLHSYTPLFFKETDVLKESDMLMPRGMGTLGGTIDLSADIARVAKSRVNKNRLRVESLVWQTLKGRLQFNENNVKVDETFPVQTQNALVDWDEFETATPLKDFAAVVLKGRGIGGSFKNGTAYMNQTTANWLINNNNPNDLKAHFNPNFVNVTYSLEDVNKILVARGYPKVVVHDAGGYDANENFNLFLADGEVVIVAQRPAGETVGDFLLTPSLHHAAMVAQGGDGRGFFSIIEVNGRPNPGVISVADLGSGKNPKIEITGGFYGGPRLIFPKSVINFNAKVT